MKKTSIVIIWNMLSLAGFLPGVELAFTEDAPAKIRRMDLDGDGLKEAEVYFEGQKVILAVLDRNEDKKPDGTIYYKNGFRERADIDNNFDGKTDTWIDYYFTGLPAAIRLDRDDDGVPDRWTYFKNGFIYKKEWDRNKDGSADYRLIIEGESDFRSPLDRHRMVQKQFDNDYDGTFDRFITVHKRMPPNRVGLAAGAAQEVAVR